MGCTDPVDLVDETFNRVAVLTGTFDASLGLPERRDLLQEISMLREAVRRLEKETAKPAKQEEMTGGSFF